MKSLSYPPPRKNALAFFLAHMGILEWFSQSKYIVNCNPGIINYACKGGKIDMLNFFKKRIECPHLSPKYNADTDERPDIQNWFISTSAINDAIMYGHVNVLDWAVNYGYEIKYTHEAIDGAAANGYIHILQWLKKAGYEIIYGECNDICFNKCTYKRIELV